MLATKECPKCGTEHRSAIRKCGCGYVWQAPKLGPAIDPMHGCCDYNQNGRRCHYAGAWSSSTVGTGPWYCTHHARGVGAPEGGDIIRQSHIDAPNPDYSLNARREAYKNAPQKLQKGGRLDYLPESIPSPQ